jgi:hypothetical protein
VVKGGKFVTLLGYEVIEAPNNLNFSRSFLFSLAIPLTHVGALVTYPVFDCSVSPQGPSWAGTSPTTTTAPCRGRGRSW